MLCGFQSPQIFYLIAIFIGLKIVKNTCITYTNVTVWHCQYLESHAVNSYVTYIYMILDTKLMHKHLKYNFQCAIWNGFHKSSHIIIISLYM